MRTHRIGSITFGLVLILFGILFLIHMMVPALKYEIIYKLWPIILIMLGSEVLAANRKSSYEKFVYDKGAIILMILICFFSMTMASVETMLWIYR
ncbi:LiaI-LiaF-like domain-containing protein [Konateibacter massiliensis]|uniref:LiaI-LiaF-like domain-containing protein n=1 Tax=Konateibacter massiliensis TaxID=2002841 RepID=UPI000C161865|nr:DUF5668 domain-containing protein [Konateibacter massiliensis]